MGLILLTPRASYPKIDTNGEVDFHTNNQVQI